MSFKQRKIEFDVLRYDPTISHGWQRSRQSSTQELRIAKLNGAIGMQKVFRGWKGRRRFRFLRRLYDWTYRREQAVLKMQHWWRMLFVHSAEARAERMRMMAEQARALEEELRKQQDAELERRGEERTVGLPHCCVCVCVGACVCVCVVWHTVHGRNC